MLQDVEEVNLWESWAVTYRDVVIIGADGKVIAKLFHEGYRKRHLSDELISAAK